MSKMTVRYTFTVDGGIRIEVEEGNVYVSANRLSTKMTPDKTRECAQTLLEAAAKAEEQRAGDD